MKRFKILSAALLAACMALATVAWAAGERHVIELTAGSPVRAGVACYPQALLAYTPGATFTATVNVVRVRTVYEPVVTTNANVETKYRVTWETGNTTNVEDYASAGNAASRAAAIQANTNLTLLGGGYTTNYTTNVYAIVTNQAARDMRIYTNRYAGATPLYIMPNDLLELNPPAESDYWVNLIVQE